MNKGLVTKSYCGYFIVEIDGVPYRSRARGKLNIKDIYVGDYVDLNIQKENDSMIESVYPRSVEIKRPPIANLSTVIVTVSFKSPNIDTYVLDKFLVMAELVGVNVVICFNKSDIEFSESIYNTYKDVGYQVISCSAATGEGIDKVKALLENNISVFIGPSGVGKSSILNSISPDLNLKTKEISGKIKRGTHTTRFVELIAIGKGMWVVDTPGFSFLENELDSQDLKDYYIEFSKYSNCKFNNCLHDKEPGCNVKLAVEQNEISADRYANYLKILYTLLDKERNKYR